MPGEREVRAAIRPEIIFDEKPIRLLFGRASWLQRGQLAEQAVVS